MANNIPIRNSHRQDAVRSGFQVYNPKLGRWIKNSSDSSQSIEKKRDVASVKGLQRGSITSKESQQICDSSVELRTSVCNEINGFLSIADGWDGEGSCGPKLAVVKDAIKFVENWSFKNPKLEPEPELVFHGAVTLVFYNEERDSRGSIEFRDNHLGIYGVRNEDDKFETGQFNSNSIKDIKKVAKNIERVLSYGD